MDSYVFFFCRVCCCWLTALCCHFTTLDASVYYPSLPSVNEARLYIFGMANFVGLISLEVGTGQVREIEQASGRQRHRVDIVRACTMCVCVCETTTTPNFLAKKKHTPNMGNEYFSSFHLHTQRYNTFTSDVRILGCFEYLICMVHALPLPDAENDHRYVCTVVWCGECGMKWSRGHWRPGRRRIMLL